MMCIKVRGAKSDVEEPILVENESREQIIQRGKKDNNLWAGWRQIEVLAFHSKQQRRANILIGIYALNLAAEGEDNYLHILHPGNTYFELIDAWDNNLNSLPKHSDEPLDEGVSILHNVYGKGFGNGDNHHKLIRRLAAWDAWYPNQESRKVFFGTKENISINRILPIETGDNQINEDDFCPFSVFQAGPFTQSGPVFITFKLWFTGETYDKFIAKAPVFPVDGPEALSIRIEMDFIENNNKLTQDAKEKWLKELSKFETYIDYGESYDVILLGGNNVNNVEEVACSGIKEAPEQPDESVTKIPSVRYIAYSPLFCLNLKYTHAESLDEISKVLLPT
jgi:hypothetical protein